MALDLVHALLSVPVNCMHTSRRTLCTMASHLGASAPAAAATSRPARTDELLPGITISVYPPDANEPPPFDEMVACVAQAFATYEPFLWGQGLTPGKDVCDLTKIEWTLQKTIRLMSTVCVCAEVCRCVHLFVYAVVLVCQRACLRAHVCMRG